LVGEILAEGLKLDFLREIHLAVLNDLLVVLRGLLLELDHQLLALSGRGLPKGQQVIFASSRIDPLKNLRQLVSDRAVIRKNTDGLLKVNSTGLLKQAP